LGIINAEIIPVKRIPIQIKIGLLMILAVVLLSATGYLSYRNLSSIVSSIQLNFKPDQRLVSIREISMDLEKAQNSIRIFSSTHDTLDLKSYYLITAGIDSKVARLRSECKNDPILYQQSDTIGKLIEENILIWNQLVSLHTSHTVDENLKQLSLRLDSSTEEARKTEKNILKRVFSSNKNVLNEKEISSNLKNIERQDSINKERLAIRESRLAITSTEIKEQFYDLITKIENEILGLINAKALAANDLAAKTYIWLAMFSVSGTLLAILVMLIIVKYVRKTQVYQVALQNSKDESEKLARTKELFMANMSHEIRTPVTAISGFTEQLLHEPLDETTTHTLRIIKSSSDHLTNIINDILDFSKLQNGKLALEQVHFNIGQILDDVYTLFERHSLRNNTRLSYSISPDTPHVLLGDPYRLKQILINLVSNSVKFTRNGKVHYSLTCIKLQSADIELIMDVVDSGIGIEESKINFIFEDFTQEEMSTTRKYGGTGLGLSIVKKLIELHSGSIECVSKKNQGTRITCHIPYMTGDEKQVRNEVEPPLYIPEEVRNLKILIVDDEEYNRLLFKTILKRWNISYHEAQNGMEALEILKTERFDLLFMDARMPGIDGLKATQFIRNDMNIPETEMPVICISAANVNEDWQKYRKAGMNAFLPKPFTEEMLLTTILAVIKDYTPVIKKEPVENKISQGKINLQNLYHISGGDELFVKQMLVSFIDSTKKELDNMQEALTTGSLATVSDHAHKMLPPCRHIGALNLYNLLRKIEENIQNKTEPQSLEILSRESILEFEVISGLIREHIAKIN
jgi:signal transduction histidine kinase/CheY-like chemotaxis protein/HPt (histidine-containing phosphotransfer) domain-containing protein/CHASE3 domain sensor protein